ncbi:ABC transporter permease [Exiguobacterium sp. SH3S2]|uniref:ABC transporter permease n=1 Tax=unclassified Exiguobacterium TaxID=2644629 RepID=UPI00103A7B20|nr:MULTISPECIES: ABC transporter permease [unclassified Exiguobacterium]TCI46133.1 ABC transporter permease [Exiguobacterium sp. SH3S3]TCI61221.1 ABC transporter permease [Exiguobacterium sp. SH3S2]
MYKTLLTIISDQITNRKLILRLARYEVKSSHAEKKLGLIWELINPALQIFIYWFVFGVGLRSNQDVNGVPFIFWLMVGLSAWFFINDAVLRGSNSINTRLGMLMKMKFPLSVIPAYVVVSRVYQHLAMLVIVILATLLFSNVPLQLTLIQLPYYFFSMIIFVFSISLLTSTLITLVKDVYPLVQSIMRMLFYLTPILWTVDSFPSSLQGLLLLNPLAYIINGYRDSILYGIWFFEDLMYMTYFWSFTAIVFILGARLHMKFRHSFNELV